MGVCLQLCVSQSCSVVSPLGELLFVTSSTLTVCVCMCLQQTLASLAVDPTLAAARCSQARDTTVTVCSWEASPTICQRTRYVLPPTFHMLDRAIGTTTCLGQPGRSCAVGLGRVDPTHTNVCCLQCKELLGSFGAIKSFELIKEKETGQSKG